MNFIKYVIFSMLLAVGISFSANTASALTSPIDDEPTSQIVSYYNSQDHSEFVLQITNTNVSSAVAVHVQTIQTVFPATGPECVEVKNFFFPLTHADTHIFRESDLGIVDDTEGMIIINAVGALGSFIPIDFPHLIGHAWIVNETNDPVSTFAVLYNSAGRNLIGGVFETIKPVNVLAPYDTQSIFIDDDVNIASLAWTDIYTAAGAYVADTGTATATGNDLLPVGVFVLDELEIPISCGNFATACATCTGIDQNDTDEGDICNDDDQDTLCSDAPETGFLALIGLSATDNFIALVGQEETNVWAGMDYAAQGEVAEGQEPEVDCEALPDPCDDLVNCLQECQIQECEDLSDCEDTICDGFPIAEGAVCSGGVATETDCTDEFEGVPVDNDGDLLANCADPDCDADPACQQEGGGGGGGGGCSIATGSVGLANALLLLIPALGIAIRRRLIG